MITIIGGGAIGLCTAYFLHKEGQEVQVIESSRSNEASGCSHGNAGMIVPSHFTPLAAPGVISQGLKWLFNSKSPFYIKPRLNKDLLHWMWLFARSANQKNILRVGDQLFRLNHASRNLYEDIIKEEDLKVAYQRQGLMMLYQTEHVEAEEQHLAIEASILGIKSDILSPQEVAKLETDFEFNIRGGVHYHSDAHLDPGSFMVQLKDYLLKAGVDIHYDVQCHGFKSTGNKLTHVNTNKGLFESQKVVVAAGVWSRTLSENLGVHIPLQGGKGYSLTIKKPPLQLKIPSILCERKIAITPMGENLRLAGTMEIAGMDRTINEHRLQGIKDGVNQYLKNFEMDWVENVTPWTGLRPVSPDGMPYIGKCKDWDNLFINTGHAMMGVSLAPISGEVLKDIILKKPVKFNTEILSPDRF
ncbi:MAG: FAD-dependent oxidoreductase [Ekhidna sp.]